MIDDDHTSMSVGLCPPRLMAAYQHIILHLKCLSRRLRGSVRQDAYFNFKKRELISFSLMLQDENKNQYSDNSPKSF